MRGFGGLLLLVLVLGTILRFWVWIVGVLAFAVLCVVLWWFTGWLDRRLEAWEIKRRIAAAKLAAIAHRADIQHAQVLAGDDRGIYGDYAPKQID